MKKVVITLIAAIAILFISSPAQADKIQFSVEAATTTPPYSDHVVSTPMMDIYNANPTTNYIDIEIGGKNCQFQSSYQPIGAYQGCNYKVTLTSSGVIKTDAVTGCDQPVCK